MLLHAALLFYVMVESKRGRKASCECSRWKGEAAWQDCESTMPLSDCGADQEHGSAPRMTVARFWGMMCFNSVSIFRACQPLLDLWAAATHPRGGLCWKLWLIYAVWRELLLQNTLPLFFSAICVLKPSMNALKRQKWRLGKDSDAYWACRCRPAVLKRSSADGGVGRHRGEEERLRGADLPLRAGRIPAIQ